MKKQVNISSINGQYVTKKYTESHPKTTVKLTVNVTKRK